MVEKILLIPLDESAHDDVLVWGGDALGEFSVRSIYKLLQMGMSPLALNNLQPVFTYFYEQLWKMILPSKIKFFMWRLSHNFLPTLENLYMRRLVNSVTCPRCRGEPKTLDHVCWVYPASREVWNLIGLQLNVDQRIGGIVEDLTLIFQHSLIFQRWMVCCALWSLWYDQNRLVHESKFRTAKEISDFILHYLKEIGEVEGGRHTCNVFQQK